VNPGSGRQCARKIESPGRAAGRGLPPSGRRPGSGLSATNAPAAAPTNRPFLLSVSKSAARMERPLPAEVGACLSSGGRDRWDVPGPCFLTARKSWQSKRSPSLSRASLLLCNAFSPHLRLARARRPAGPLRSTIARRSLGGPAAFPGAARRPARRRSRVRGGAGDRGHEHHDSGSALACVVPRSNGPRLRVPSVGRIANQLSSQSRIRPDHRGRPLPGSGSRWAPALRRSPVIATPDARFVLTCSANTTPRRRGRPDRTLCFLRGCEAEAITTSSSTSHGAWFTNKGPHHDHERRPSRYEPDGPVVR